MLRVPTGALFRQRDDWAVFIAEEGNKLETVFDPRIHRVYARPSP